MKIWVSVLYSLLSTRRGVQSNILTASETVDLILQGKSLIRFGDGEFGIDRQKNIHYQKWSNELQHDFESIKKSFEENEENCPYLLAVPKKYMQCSSAELCKKRVLASSWAEARLFFKRNFDLSATYGDSFLFEKANATVYSKLWDSQSDNRTIIFVHNNPMFAEQFAKRYHREVKFVQCPSKDAYSVVDNMLNQILEIISSNSLSTSSVQLVISAGPAGKVLVYKLAYMGYSCIDAGHCWDDPLES